MKKIAIIITGVLLAGLTSCYYNGPCIDGSGPIVSETRPISGFSSVGNTGSYDVYITQADSFYVEVVCQENLLPYIETYVSGSTLIIETRSSICLRNSVPIKVYVTMPEINVISLSGSGMVRSDRIEDSTVEVVLSGSGGIVIDTIFGNNIILGNSGSGNVFSNYVITNSIRAILSGSGGIEAGIVIDSEQVSVNHSSSGRVQLGIENGDKVNGTLSGSGRIILHGEAGESAVVNNGSGKFDALNLRTGNVLATCTGSGDIFVFAIDYLQATIIGSGDIVYRGDPELSFRITGSGDLRKY